MSKKRAARTAPSAVTATINLAGKYQVGIASHQAGPGANVTLTVGPVMICFQARDTLEAWDAVWNHEARILMGRLPEGVTMPTQTDTVGLLIRPRWDDPTRVRSLGNPLAIQVGVTVWVMHDQDAYLSTAQAIRTARDIGRVTLPARY